MLMCFPDLIATLDCLNRAKAFTPLDLKTCYRQVEFDNARKPFTAFTVGPEGSTNVRECHLASSMCPQPFRDLWSPI